MCGYRTKNRRIWEFKSMKIVFCSLALLISSMNVAAASITSKVTKVGCHIDRNMCFVYIEAPIQSSCSLNDNSLRWDGVNGRNVKSALAILLAAKTAGQKVTFGGVGDVCYGDYPTFKWVRNN